MAEGRTDPQRRWTIFVCLASGDPYTCGCDREHGEDCDEYKVVVVPADDQLTAEELKALLYSVDVPVGSKDSRLLAKLRRLAGRED